MKIQLSTDFTDSRLYNNSYIWPLEKIINNENQMYVERGTAGYEICVQDGALSTYPQRNDILNTDWVSGLATTHGKFSFKYGRIDVSATLPTQDGVWPAIWMLAEHEQWPAGKPILPEIDIMEHIGESSVHGSAHAYSVGEMLHHSANSDAFKVGELNTYSLIWNESEIKWLLNNKVYFTLPTPENMKETRFHLLFNVAVGGNWLSSIGAPPATQSATMQIHSIDIDTEDYSFSNTGASEGSVIEGSIEPVIDEGPVHDARVMDVSTYVATVATARKYNRLVIEGLSVKDLDYIVSRLNVEGS